MQVIANQQLARNRRRLGTVLHLAALGVFTVGLVVSLQTDPTVAEVSWGSWAAIAVGMILYIAGQSQLRRWGPSFIQAQRIGDAIRGLDDRYKLYAFLSSKLPDLVLVGPGGVQVILARGEGGRIRCERDRWKKEGQTFLLAAFDPPLGNLTAEASEQVRKMRAVLDQAGLEEVPVSALVVFTNPKVQLRIENCAARVARLKDLKDVVRRLAGKGQQVVLAAARVRDVQALFDRQMQAAGAWR